MKVKKWMVQFLCVAVVIAMLPIDVFGLIASSILDTTVQEEPAAVVETAALSVEYDDPVLMCSDTSTNSAVLQWNDIFEDTTGSYDLYQNGTLIAAGITDCTYTVSGLTPATLYVFKVSAKEASSNTVGTSEELSVYTDLSISSDTAFFEETTVGDLYVSSKTLNLNGQTVHVKGNVILSGGTLFVNEGKLYVDGDFRCQKETISKNVKSYSYGSGYLKMVSDEDYVCVNGNYIANSYYSQSGYMTNGVLEVKRDFTQKTQSSGENFYATDNHKVILSGDKKQTVSFDSISSKFAVLELKNYTADGVYVASYFNIDSMIDNGCKITFNSGIPGWTLNQDETYAGDLNLATGTLDLNGHKLTVNGNLTQSGGTVNINGGELVVTGDYKIQTLSGGVCAGILNMTNAADQVTIGGAFYTRSNVDHSNYLTAGTMTVGGDVYVYSNATTCFKTSGKHKVVLNGTVKQTLNFANSSSESNSRFNILEITNTSADGVVFSSGVWVQKQLTDTNSILINSRNLYLGGSAVLTDGRWSHDLRVNSNITLSSDWDIKGSLYLDGGVFDLKGKTLNVGYNLILYSGTLYVDSGKVNINGDFRQQKETVSSTGVKSYSQGSSGYLKMVNANDYVLVDGSFYAVSYINTTTYLTNGILEIKGDFTQITNDSSSNYSNNFYATGSHKVILSGDRKQTVNFDSTNSKFATLEIQNTSSDGIVVSSYLTADSVVTNNHKVSFADGSVFGWTLNQDAIINGNLTIGYGTLDLNGHKLTINGSLTQSGGTININGGELAVTDDYKIQTSAGSVCAGILNMTNAADQVSIGGAFYTRSNVDHTSYMTAGTMTIGGDMYVYSNATTCFKTSGTHKVILNGTVKQTVNFANSTSESNSRFNILEITNTSTNGVVFSSGVWVQKQLTDTDSILTNSSNIYLGGSAVLTDGRWSHDLRINSNVTLSSDWDIKGSLYLDGGVFDLKGKTLHIGENLILNSGTLYVDSGKVMVSGDFRQQKETISSAGVKSYSQGSSGYLKMVNADDYVLVYGSFYAVPYINTTTYLTNGILEIKGDFTQITSKSSNIYSNNFYATGNHKVILSGDKIQAVNFDSPNSKFATLEINNNSGDGVVISSYLTADSVITNNNKVSFTDGSMFGWTLNQDETYSGDLNLAAGTLNLNGHKLTINGSLTQSGGTININGGELSVTGDYKIQTLSGGVCGGILNMTNTADQVSIGGAFYTRSNVDHSNYLTAGTMTVSGDLYVYSNATTCFKTSGTHKVILNGTVKQTVNFANSTSESNSRFNILEITNTSTNGVVFSSGVWVQKQLTDTDSILTNSSNIYLGGSAILTDGKWSHDLRINSNMTLSSDWEIGGSLYINGGTFDLKGKTLHIGENLILYSGTLYVDSGKINISGDFRQQKETISSAGVKSYSQGSSGYLKMVNADDYVLVNGSFVANGISSSSNNLTNGILEVYGDFSQITYTTSSNTYSNNFYATGSHKVILSGDKKQTLSFDSSNSKFATIEIQNTSGDGIVISLYLTADSVVTNNNKVSFIDGSMFGWTLNQDETYAGDLNLAAGTLDLNGHKLTVNGNLKQSGGMVNINSGALTVTGDYKIQTSADGVCAGILNMTNAADQVSIGGAFYTRSNVDHSNYLTAGTMTVGGDFYVYNNSSYCFKTSGTQKVILNGTVKQTVNFANNTSESNSRFNILEIMNTSADGVVFSSGVWVQKQLTDTDSVLTNSSNIYLGGSAVLTDGKWSHDLRINSNMTLSSDWEIGGSLYLSGGTFNINGRKLTAAGNIVLGSGTLYINGGQLYVGQDLRIQSGTLGNDGAIGYTYSSGYLKMVSVKDYIRVSRNFITQASNSHSGYLTNGILEVKGKFTQITYNSPLNFFASGNHKVILNGTKLQKVTFDSTTSQFNILEINKSLASGYDFSRQPLWNTLEEKQSDYTAPAAVADLSTNGCTSTKITLSWTESTDDAGVEGYDIYRNGIRVGSTGTYTYTDTGLKADTSYTYYIIAYDMMRNESDWSNILETRTDVDADAPSQPLNLKASSMSESEISLTWTASSDNTAVKEYQIYRNDVLIGKSNGTNYTDSNVSQDLYTYYVKAVDVSGNTSKPSDTVSADTMPPTTPVLSLASYHNLKAVLTWTCEDNVSVSGYKLYRNGALYTTITSAQYENSTLTIDSTYEYYVVAYDQSGNVSEMSNVIRVYTGEDTTVPQVTKITPMPARYAINIPLKITATDNAGVTSVKIQFSSDEKTWKDLTVLTMASVTAVTCSYNMDVSDFSDGSVFVRAVAYDAAGNASSTSVSPMMEYVVDHTAPSVPQDVSVNLLSNQVEVTWTVSKDPDLNYFRVYRSENAKNSYTLVADQYNYSNYIDSSIVLGKKYDYKITAVDSAGNESGYSVVVTGGIISDTEKPKILSAVPTTGSLLHENHSVSISCSDNIMLKNIIVEFSPQGTDQWETMYMQDFSTRAEVVKFTLDTGEFTIGLYDMRVKLTDASGNVSDYYTTSYDYRKCSLQNPKLTVTPGGWKVSLNWSLAADSSLAGYNVYKRSADNNTYTVVSRTTKTNYTDAAVTAGKTYFYYVEAVDTYGNTIKSTSLSAVPTNEDTMPPQAEAGFDGTTIQGTTVNFNASSSSDNHYIASYAWDFGDGASSSSVKASHTYSKAGTYTVTLTIKDSAGNKDTDTIEITVLSKTDYCYAEFQVVDSSDQSPISNAVVYCELPGTNVTEYATDSNGCVQIAAKKGTYKFSFYKAGYLPETKTATVSSDSDRIMVALDNGEVVTGDIKVERLDLNEIIKLGVDITAPENQYVYKYEIHAEYKDSSRTIIVEANGTGVLLYSDDRWTSDETQEYIYSPILRNNYVKVIPNDDPSQPPTVAVLNVSIESTWLKEFFNVNLTLINNASTQFSIQDATAQLELPNGLSLAATNKDNDKYREIGTIGGGKTKSVSWIIRGDTAGEYNLSAAFSGYLMPFNKQVRVDFQTDTPIKVYGNDALKLTINQTEWSNTRGCLVTSFTLTNISDLDIYNPEINFSGYSDFSKVNDMQLTYPNGIIEAIPWNGGSPDKAKTERFLPALLTGDESDGITLKPGESINGTFTATK
ncbi:MAG: PKD domain-containing protein [Oscillospiraceae bacterium]